MGALRAAGDDAHPAHPRGGPCRLSPLLRHVPGMADVRGARLGVLVRMANFAVANSGRTVDWLHLAGPRYLRSEDRSFFRPLVDLEPGDARVFLGIVLPIDGVPGPQAPARHRLALHLRLRRGHVLRVRPPARRGRARDHARARRVVRSLG